MRLRLLRADTVSVVPANPSQASDQSKRYRQSQRLTSNPSSANRSSSRKTECTDAARIVRTRKAALQLGAGDMLMRRGHQREGNLLADISAGLPLVDPISNETLGYVAIYLGDAKVNDSPT